MKYTQDMFQPPERICPYVGTLGRNVYEEIAARIIAKSQEAGDWIPLGEVKDSHYHDEMVDDKLLELTGEGYVLTERALEKILKIYPAYVK
jgi:hypothetical protein